MLSRRLLISFLAAPWVAIIQGCSHYYLPASHLQSPEAHGLRQAAHFDLAAIQSGSDLSAAPNPHPSSKPKLKSSPLNYAIAFSHGITEKFDLGVKFQVGAPFMAYGKYQFAGPPEDQAKLWDFSCALSAGAGYAKGSDSSMSAIDLGLIGGVRLGKHHLLSLEPFYAMASLTDPASASAGSSSQMGASLIYQYEAADLYVRPELTWYTGSAGSSDLGGFALGVLAGLKIGKD